VGHTRLANQMQILCADDDLVMLEILRVTLTEWGYEVIPATDGDDAWEKLSAPDGPRLAIVDWMMPGLDGLEVIEKVRTEKREPYVYMLLLSARNDKTDLVQGMMSGADDYIAKPFDPHELRMRLRAGQRILDLQAQLLESQARLERQATHDPLTGLYNRRAIITELEQELSRGRRTGEPVATVLVDLDHFKGVNDVYGHQAGDEVLREAASRMRAMLRNYDRIGRYGGEEFLILLSNCDARAGEEIAERIRDILEIAPIECRSGRIQVEVTASFGVAVSSPDALLESGALISAADAALYRAKQGGRNRIETAEPADFKATQTAP
jgi:two-component system cell cycle response regulator